MNAAHCRGPAEREPGGDAGAEADDEPQRQLPALGLEEGFDPRLAHGAEPRRRKSAEPRCGSGASSMLGALTHSIWPGRTKESALERKRQYDQRKHPSTGVVTRFAPSPTGFLHIGGARTALVQLAVRAPPRRQISAADRGHRQGALDPAGDRRDPRRPALARPRLATATPYFQSQFEARHAEVAHELIERGARLSLLSDARRNWPRGARRRRPSARPFRIDSEWRDRATRARAGRQPFVVRLKAPREGETVDRRPRPGPGHASPMPSSTISSCCAPTARRPTCSRWWSTTMTWA